MKITKQHFKIIFPLGIILLILSFSGSSINQDTNKINDELPSAVLGTAPEPGGSIVNYFPEDPNTSGYLTLPEGSGKKPGLIIVHEWDGLKRRVRQMADALADEGYVVLAADMYGGRTGSNRDENVALMNETRADPDKLVRNLDAAAKFLRERDDVIGDKIGTMGWCYGGGVVLTYAIGGENHAATAIFYGSLISDPKELKRIGHDVLGIFAENDRGIPPSDVREFEKALRKAGIPNEIHIYDDVGHGFFLWVDRDPGNRAAAADAWKRLKNFLSRTLGE
ncbi:MAG: dienelactone hydrolase family protein [Candidatus Marinimicrobia bacterium]|nr:dienelactone hydrolase family protein [Candidatus Neomarinimicrobiota bacterium]